MRENRNEHVFLRKAHLVTDMKEQVHKRGHSDALNLYFLGSSFRDLLRSCVISQLLNVPKLPILSPST